MRADFALLKKVLSLPTAPFHEEEVVAFVRDCCGRWGLPVRQDPYGNLKVTYKRGKRAKPLAFMAHMDHPGFEVVRGGKRALVNLLGGVLDKNFLKAKVVICNGAGLVRGRVLKAVDKRKRQFVVAVRKAVAKKSFGWFDLPAARFQNGLVWTKGVDNVASVALLLNFLQVLSRGKRPAHVICIFTRAEEVGCVGALGAASSGLLPRHVPLIVMEASSAVSGKVAIGGGPVLRVGDRASVFSPALDLWLRGAALHLKKKDRRFEFQRGLLQGGTCEASPLSLRGYTVGGLALPLGNYHNNGPRGYACEYISKKDYENMLKWLLTLPSFPNARHKALERSSSRHFRKFGRRLLQNQKT